MEASAAETTRRSIRHGQEAAAEPSSPGLLGRRSSGKDPQEAVSPGVVVGGGGTSGAGGGGVGPGPVAPQPQPETERAAEKVGSLQLSIGEDGVPVVEHSPLHDVASLGRVHDVEQLIQAGADREKKDDWGRTPMHLAAALGHVEVVRLLAKLGAHLDHGDSVDKSTPMHLAAAHGQYRVIGELVLLRAFVDAKTTMGRTALHLAAEQGRRNECEQLIRLKANTEVRDLVGDTPLRLAVRSGHTNAVLSKLIGARCDLNAQDEEGATPLHLATCKQRMGCIESLVSRRAGLEDTDNLGLTPLHRGSRDGEAEACELLIRLAASMNSRTQGHHTPLHIAVIAEELGVIEVMVKQGADKEAQDHRGHTPLHTAVEYARPKALAMLLQRGVQKDAKTKNGDTALHLACRDNRPDLIRVVMRGGADCNLASRRGHTALHVAADRGYVKAAEALLDSANRAAEERSDKLAVKVNALDGEISQQTPLHLAAWQGRVEICELLVKNNAYVDVPDREGNTPMNLAIMRGHRDVVQAVMRLNADPHRKDKYGMHPVQQACVSGSLEVLKMLKDLRLEPKLDEEPWRRPLALAKANHHRELILYLFVPVPKKLLGLALPRAHSKDTVSVTFGAVVCEPECISLTLQCAKKPPGPGKPDEEKLFQPLENGGGIVQEVEVEPAEITTGKTMQISGLEEGTSYMLRLFAKNASGQTAGGTVEITTKKEEDHHQITQRSRRGRERGEAQRKSPRPSSPTAGDKGAQSPPPSPRSPR